MRKLEFLLILLLGLITMVSCNDNTIEQNNLSTDQSKKNTIRKIRGDNKYDVLGFGCDVTGEYLDQMKQAYPVLDANSLKAANYIVEDNNVHTKVVINGGTNLKTLSTKLSAKIANTVSIPISEGAVFTGGFNSEFIGNNTITTKYS